MSELCSSNQYHPPLSVAESRSIRGKLATAPLQSGQCEESRTIGGLICMRVWRRLQDDEGMEGDDDESMSEDEGMSEEDDIIDEEILDDVDRPNDAGGDIALDVQRLRVSVNPPSPPSSLPSVLQCFVSHLFSFPTSHFFDPCMSHHAGALIY